MAGLITRFAPSPTGPLHLGHAFAALTAFDLARNAGGTCLLRIEDLDEARCRPIYEAQIFADLQWLGLSWPEPVLRQSTRRAAYDAALARLQTLGVTYRCTCTRADIRAALSAPQEGAAGADGPLYPGTCRHAGHQDPGAAIRLDMARATRLTGPVSYVETGPLGPPAPAIGVAELCATIGDVVLARRDLGGSYHLAVCVDDAAQGVTLVTRGADLVAATPLHRVLQILLGLPEPAYHHHRLIRDETGKRLAKRDDSRALALYRAAGESPAEIRERLGL